MKNNDFLNTSVSNSAEDSFSDALLRLFRKDEIQIIGEETNS